MSVIVENTNNVAINHDAHTILKFIKNYKTFYEKFFLKIIIKISQAFLIKNSKRTPKRIKRKIYFTEKNNSTKNKDDTQKVHHSNRDTEQPAKKTRAWTFLESVAQAYEENRATFLTGFFTSIIVAAIILSQSPHDNKFKEFLDRPPETREPDRQMGYERTIQRQRERNPELYDA